MPDFKTLATRSAIVNGVLTMATPFIGTVKVGPYERLGIGLRYDGGVLTFAEDQPVSVLRLLRALEIVDGLSSFYEGTLGFAWYAASMALHLVDHAYLEHLINRKGGNIAIFYALRRSAIAYKPTMAQLDDMLANIWICDFVVNTRELNEYYASEGVPASPFLNAFDEREVAYRNGYSTFRRFVNVAVPYTCSLGALLTELGTQKLVEIELNGKGSETFGYKYVPGEIDSFVKRRTTGVCGRPLLLRQVAYGRTCPLIVAGKNGVTYTLLSAIYEDGAIKVRTLVKRRLRPGSIRNYEVAALRFIVSRSKPRLAFCRLTAAAFRR